MNITSPVDFSAMDQAADRASALLRSLGNGTRLMILCHLSEGEKTVGALRDLLDIGQSPLSQHLARLRKDGLVATRRESQTIHYRIASAEVERVIETLYGLYCGPGRDTS
jgi:ArsR family transcriptional regulator, virulence genes transcriptional regulator